MNFLLSLFTLCACILWIGYVALTVMAIAEPSIERGALWILATPVMLLVGFVAAKYMDRLAAIG